MGGQLVGGHTNAGRRALLKQMNPGAPPISTRPTPTNGATSCREEIRTRPHRHHCLMPGSGHRPSSTPESIVTGINATRVATQL